MKKSKYFKNLILIFLVIPFIIFSGNTYKKIENNYLLKKMMQRIKKQSKLNKLKTQYFQKLTPILFEYLETQLNKKELQLLYDAKSINQLKHEIEKLLNKNVIEFGENMFAYFENKSTHNKNINQWSVSTSQHFVFLTRPGSNAESEIDFIKESAEKTYSSIIKSLGVEKQVLKNSSLLYNDLSDFNIDNSSNTFFGKTVVFLYHKRDKKAKNKIGNNTMANMSFGATILESKEKNSKGKLIAEINLLYFNPFSLSVLQHEISHAVLFLGSFNPNSLIGKQLKGKSDLRKAFFNGYIEISPFLHEGIGDYAIYHKTFYNYFPLFPKPEKIVINLLNSGHYIPLKKLIIKGKLFRMLNHKEYSLQAAVFINYLIKKHGKNKLKTWLFSGKNILKNFKSVYNKNIEEMEKKWHNYLRQNN